MDLEFKGMDPATPNGGSPTVWVERAEREIVIQGWKPCREMYDSINATEWVEGHPTGIPDHEAVVRIPARMIPILRKACDDAERAGLLGPAEGS